MYKFIIITIIVLLLLIAGTFAYNNYRASNAVPPVVDGTDFPQGGRDFEPTPSESGTVTVETASGSVIVTDISTYPEVQDVGSGMYVLHGTREDSEQPFSILYSKNNNSFIVSLEDNPFAVYRQMASEYFLTLFDVTEKEACELNVYVGIPYGISPGLSGTDLGLSYCPDSKTI